MATIVGFNIDNYRRFSINHGDYKNIVPLEEMTPEQKYELAVSDEDSLIWDSIDSFLTDLNDGCVDTENMCFYKV